MTHKEKLIFEFKKSEHKTLLDFLIEKSERDHKKQVLMAGDLGKAFSQIGDLEIEINQLKN